MILHSLWKMCFEIRIHDYALKLLKVQNAEQQLLTLSKGMQSLSQCNWADTGFNILINFCTLFQSDFLSLINFCTTFSIKESQILNGLLDAGIMHFSERYFVHDKVSRIS